MPLDVWCNECGTYLDFDHGYGNAYGGPDLAGDYCSRCGDQQWKKAENAFDVRALLNAHRDAPLTQATIDAIMALVDSDRLLAANEESIRQYKRRERERELREAAHSRLLTDEENQEMIELTDGEYKPYTKEMQEADRKADEEMWEEYWADHQKAKEAAKEA